MSPLFRSRKRTALSGVALLLALTGGAVAVGTTTGSSPAAAEEVLPAFDDCDALPSRMAERGLPDVGDYGFGNSGYDAYTFPQAVPGAGPAWPAEDATSGAPAAA